MNNLPNDIIYNICRFLPYSESLAFENISSPINKMILNSEIHKFNKEYVKITSNFGCTAAFLGCDMIYSERYSGRKRSERCHIYKIETSWPYHSNFLTHIKTEMICFECYYKYEKCPYSKKIRFTKKGNLITNDIKIISQKLKM